MNPEKLNIVDPEVFSIIQKEESRQQHEIDLIASENYASQAVREATGSVLTNKYAEGYPGKRYYGGCEFVDMAENLAIERCKKIFGADHVNVQPHAGSQANMTAYAALLQPGDTILGMALAAGGHLTHGHGVNFSGGLYKAVQYGVDPQTGLLNYGEIEKLAQEHKPKLIIAGASAYSRTIDFERFAAIAQSVGAYFMADIAHIAGLVAAGLHPSPIPYADIITSTTHKTLRGPRGGLIMCKAQHASAVDRAIMPGLQGGPFMNSIAAKAVAFHEALQPDFIHYQKQIIKNAHAMVDAALKLGFDIVTGGTDNHMFIIDLRSKKVNGRIAEVALAAAGISVSRSCIPNDPEKPWVTSGIRIGTPAITTRGMLEPQAHEIMNLAHEAIIHATNSEKLAEIKKHVQEFCTQFPLV
jgi:glycine hydroxymethyltransferase